MILLIGGMAAGKRSFVCQRLGYRPDQIAVACLDERPVVADLQELLRQYDPEQLLPILRQKQVVICNEVGSGVVPLAEQERAWREAVGRLCCRLAAEADTVVRLVCGLPMVLKGSL